MMVYTSPDNKPFELTEHYQAYGLIISGPLISLKVKLLAPLMVLAKKLVSLKTKPTSICKQMVLFLESKNGVVLPKERETLGLIIPLDKHNRMNVLKAGILKYYLTVIERVAEW